MAVPARSQSSRPYAPAVLAIAASTAKNVSCIGDETSSQHPDSYQYSFRSIVDIQIGFNASFRGNGYLELDRNEFSTQIDQNFTTAVVVFSTTKSNGLLLWWGQKAGEEFTGQDFIALAIVDGYIEYALRLNGEEAEIRNTDHPVNDGERHIVILRRADNTAMLEVDRLSITGETRPTVRKQMHLPGNVFIGKCR